jgi:hypothetical protein
MISVPNTLERKGSTDINVWAAVWISLHLHIGRWQRLRMCKRSSMGFGDPENSYTINFPIEREISPKLQEIPSAPERSDVYKSYAVLHQPHYRHVTIKLCHYFVQRFGIFTSKPPYSVIVEDCLVTHVKHQLEWFPIVCENLTFCHLETPCEQQ